jgi:hypothetical protein
MRRERQPSEIRGRGERERESRHMRERRERRESRERTGRRERQRAHHHPTPQEHGHHITTDGKRKPNILPPGINEAALWRHYCLGSIMVPLIPPLRNDPRNMFAKPERNEAEVLDDIRDGRARNK